jgi:hypothetical protein
LLNQLALNDAVLSENVRIQSTPVSQQDHGPGKKQQAANKKNKKNSSTVIDQHSAEYDNVQHAKCCAHE